MYRLGLKSTFCTCILVGQNHQRIHYHVRDPGIMSGWCWGWCCLSCLGSQWIPQLLDRVEMRQQYGELSCLCLFVYLRSNDSERLDLKGGTCNAGLTSCCCFCCEAIQTSKELDYVRSEGNVPNESGYTRPRNMDIPQRNVPLQHLG
jgi:Cys-rich protein (TIGR01571 family)